MTTLTDNQSALTGSTANSSTNVHSYYYAKRNLVKLERIQEEFKYIQLTQTLMISHCGLTSIPEDEFQKSDEEEVRRLRRFDISHNFIHSIPSYILNTMTNLREIWLNNNPMTQFPTELLSLPLLETIDIHNTKIQEIPLEIVELKQLVTFDWRNTPLSINLKNIYLIDENDLNTLRDLFQNLYIRKLTRKNLYEYLYSEFYLQDADKSYANVTILGFIEELSNIFVDLDDFISFSHRPGNFIPPTVDQIIKLSFNKSAEQAKDLFYKMKRDTDRKRLAADVEIKVRGKYFDRIERKDVVTLIDSIYVNVHALEDMEFLVQYAYKVLPHEPSEATGERVWQNILDLQDELIQKREASVVALSNALIQIYPEQKPETLMIMSREIASFFQVERFATEKELLRMTQLTGDASKVFPPDFAAIVPQEIVSKAQELIFKNLK